VRADVRALGRYRRLPSSCLEDVAGPAADAAHGEHRGEEVESQADRVVGGGGVEIDVGVDALGADPRATFLKTFSKQIAADTGNMGLYEKSNRSSRSWPARSAPKGIYPTRRFLLRHHLPLYRPETRPLHPDVRHEPHQRLGRPRPRATRRQPPVSPERGVRRPRTARKYVPLASR